MKQFLFFAATCLLLASCSQPKTETAKLTLSKLDKKIIPSPVRYEGNLDTAVKYSDAGGDYIVVTSYYNTTKPGDDEEEGVDGIRLEAYCYKLNDSKWHLAWQTNDFVDNCDVDLAGEFIKTGFAITDLNHDGQGEVWLMYRLACRGDVSPSTIKIIMHEGFKKYALRGESRVKVNATDYYGGDYKLDKAFQKGPEVFRKYALQLWDKNHNEDFDENHPSGIIK
ncbi:MAG: hypothetical protein JST19_03340 [Bacteroidetes bacterium]|nr:hypothetical protein [Bacteroidota bacterium]